MEGVSKPARRLWRVVSFGRIVGEAIEATTANAQTLAANRFTAADIVVGYALWLADRIGLGADVGIGALVRRI
jgi:glutathione S-transferase